MKRQLEQLRNWGAVLLFGLTSPILADAATSTGVSPIVTVDTRVGGIAVSGRVLDAMSRAPISGATATLAGQNTSSSGAGLFSFASVSLSSGNTLAVSKSGYATYTGTVPVPAGATVVTVPDILLQVAPVGNKPLVTGIRAKYDGLFLSAASLANEYTASVDWAGRTPKQVEFYVNGMLRGTVTTSSTEATWNVDMAQWFVGSFSSGANQLSAVAVDTLNVRSPMFTQTIRVIPMPPLLMAGAGVLAPFQFLPGNDPVLSFSVKFPDDQIPSEAVKDIPLLGKFGWNCAVGGGFEYALNSGEWQAHIGIEPYGRWAGRSGERPHSTLLKPQFFFGNKTVDFSVAGRAEGRATQTSGISLDEIGVDISLDFDQEIFAFYLTDYVPLAQWVRCLDWFQRIGVDPNSVQRVTVYGELGAALALTAEVNPAPIKYMDTTVSLTLGPRAEYAPDLKLARGEVTLGGRVTGEFQIHPGLDFNSVVGALYGRVSFTVWSFNILNEEFVLLNYKWPQAGLKGMGLTYDLRSAAAAGSGWVWVPVVSRPFETIRRDYLTAGSERFVADGKAVKLSGTSTTAVSPLEAFRTMGRWAANGPTRQSKGEQPANGPELGGGLQFDQADLPLLENVFPGSAPAMAGHGQELMLLYVTDNGSPTSLQFTDINWTRFDGTNWSVANTIQTNTQAEFSPQVAYDGNGDAVAVWERVADPNFNQTNLTAMAAQMEIVWSKWNHTSGQWSVPQPLTGNGYLDHAPLICGLMADGSVLAVWTRNVANLLMGTNGTGSQVLWVRWNPTTQNWSLPQKLLADLPYRLSQSLAGTGNRAVYAWTQDPDGVLTNDVDQQVFYAQWQGGVWGAVSSFPANGTPNKNVRVAVAAASTNQVLSGEESFESGNFLHWPWMFEGNAPWTVQNSVVQSGSFAAASGAVGDNQSSAMKVTVHCPAGLVSFAYKVSSESGWDYLRFYVDAQQMGSWSGEAGWATASYPVGSGEHTFQWTYSKDGSENSGSNKAWVDQISIPAEGGSVYLVWQKGANLVLSQNFSTNFTLVRADSQTVGFADYAMTIGPAGNLALLWQEMSQAGSDAQYRVLDPVSATWSKDAQLFNDSPLERSFAPVWDDVGSLTVAYNKVEIIYTNKTVTLEGGGTVTITNVPQSGRVDLCVTKRRLIKDVALAAGDFTVSAENYLPGAAVTLSATLRNSGDVAVNNAVVAFYDGNPASGGMLITNVAFSGWLEGAATNTVNALWVVPEPATNYVLYAVADPAGAITEFDEGNNTQALSIGGTDLAVSLVSYSAETNGAVRVIAQVQNLGAPSATNSVLAIRRAGNTNAPLATVAVPLLEPGRLAQVALDLPAGTQPEGEQVYTLRSDDTLVTTDVETNNNTSSFAVNLWIDSDGDGMPDGWEIANGFGSTNAADALLDSDGDGMNNLAEYRAGTRPDDPTSYLRITGLTVGGTNGLQIAWGSSSNRLYTVLRSPHVSLPFGAVAEHILGTPPENVYLDTTATNASQFFYRVKVE